MSSRHLELLRDLSSKKREQEDQQKREEERQRRRESLLRERLQNRGSRPSSEHRESSIAESLPCREETATAEERRQWKTKCNKNIERRQEEAIEKVRQTVERYRIKQEREQLKTQWRRHHAQSYLVDNCSDPDLKEFLENKAKKPKPLPKLPVLPGRSAHAENRRSLESECEDDMSETKDDKNVALDSPDAAVSRTTACCQNEANSSTALTCSSPRQANEEANPLSIQGCGQKPIPKGVTTFINRLRLTRMRSSCSSLCEWKHRNGCAQDAKVFICWGGYPDLKEAMLRRGWFLNEDKDSKYYDFKWTMASAINHEILQENQVVNHFDRNREITTKVGLTRNLWQSASINGIDTDEFYPRAFDLYDPLERAEFALNFKYSKAQSILIGFLQDIDGSADLTFCAEVVKLAHKVCMRLVTDPEEVMDCGSMAEDLGRVSKAEWKILSKVNLDDVVQTLQGGLTEEELENLIQKKATRSNDKKKSEDDKDIEKKGKKESKKKKKTEDPVIWHANVSSFTDLRGQHLISQVRRTMGELAAKSRQSKINGRRNAWIVKPSGKSRGRGIKVVRELDEIFKITESDGFQWICQKYIESPHTVRGHKCDIRQWVLVTDWNPLTVWVWKHPYFRFACKKYDDSISDRSEFMHLTNFNITSLVDAAVDKNDDLQAQRYMWFRQQYQEYLHSRYCKCEKHHTPWLEDPPYTCEYFGVKWEDVMFVAKEEDDDDEDHADDAEQEPADCPSHQSRVSRNLSAESATADAAAPELVDTSSTVLSSMSDSSSTTAGGLSSSPSESTCLSSCLDACGMPSPDSSSEPASSLSRACSHPHTAEGPQCPDNETEQDRQREPCEDLWTIKVLPQIEEAIIRSLACVQDEVRHRKSSFEIFGYDFMFSDGPDHPDVWLIEVNSSPACDYSTPVTCPLVKKMMEDTVKVVVDQRENADGNTGEWELLRHGFEKYVPQKTTACAQLAVAGKELIPPKGFKQQKKRKKKKQKQPNEVGKSLKDEVSDEEEEDSCET